MSAEGDVEKVWSEFWWPLLVATVTERGEDYRHAQFDDGTLTLSGPLLAQIKRELFDLHTISTVVPQVYSHATGGAMSKATYNDVGQITALIDEHYAEIAKEQMIDALLDANDNQTSYDPEVEVFAQYVMDGLDITLDELTDAAKDRERIQAMLAEQSSTPVQRPVETVELPEPPADASWVTTERRPLGFGG